LLAILKEENVKASFFLLGSEIEKYPELIESILQNGHDIGNHSFSHKTTKEIGFSNYCSDIVKTAGLIQKYSHFETKMFRSPYGELTLKLLSFIVLNKWNYISWTIDSRDSFIKDRADLVKYFETIPVCNGDIYLFHDDCAHTVEALPTIIRHLKNKGYTFTTLSEALKLR
jgi:peptidoglycan/xylan/chitin deacetylase (PgdA/CDA1 family)